uniref:Uncharacterized protein n=1 Tax=Anguilla anguilla TaxID=7936 RepID=A0A0E9QNA8_ANGAN
MDRNGSRANKKQEAILI